MMMTMKMMDVDQFYEHLDELYCSDAAVCGLSLISWEPWCCYHTEWCLEAMSTQQYWIVLPDTYPPP